MNALIPVINEIHINLIIKSKVIRIIMINNNLNIDLMRRLNIVSIERNIIRLYARNKLRNILIMILSQTKPNLDLLLNLNIYKYQRNLYQ